MGKTILLLHGPNLNIAQRELDVYGHYSLENVQKRLESLLKNTAFVLQSFSSNHEGKLLDFMHEYVGRADGLIINPAAYTHTSIALRDAVSAMRIPCVEVHLSNIYRRETFRHHSYFHDVAQGVIFGFGAMGYELALRALLEILSS